MVIRNPIDIENAYRDLIRSHANSPSCAARLSAIGGFLELAGDPLIYESYILDVLKVVQVPPGHGALSGEDPAELETLISRLERCRPVIPETMLEIYQQDLRHLRRHTALSFFHIGEWERMLTVLGLPESEAVKMLKEAGQVHQLQNPDEKIARDQQLCPPVPDSADSVVETLHDIKNHLYLSGEKAVSGEVNKLAGMLEGHFQKMAGSVMVPVVERTMRGKSTGYGRLRQVSLDLDVSGSAVKDEIRISVSAPGSRSGVENQVSTPLKAARHLADAIIPGIRKRFVRGILDFNTPGAYHEGESANLGIAALFCSELWRLSGNRGYYQLAGRLAITGGLDEEGNVLDIDEEGIAPKLKAAFYSSITHLAVPAQQEEIFRAELKNLNSKWPRRNLAITGIRTLQDIFYDRRLTDYRRVPATILAGRWMRKYGFSSAGLILLIVLSALLGMAWYGPIDKNPVMGEYQGQYLVVKNKNGQTIEKIDVGPQTAIIYSYAEMRGRQFLFTDVTGDGMNEVVWLEASDETHGKNIIKVKRIGKREVLWEKKAVRQHEFPEAIEYIDQNYRFVSIEARYDPELKRTDVYTISWHRQFYPNFLDRINGLTGELHSSYYHPGGIQKMLIMENDPTGRGRLLIAGTNNAFNKAFISILDPDDLNGQAPSTSPYQVAGLGLAEHVQYVKIPPTIVGQTLGSLSRRNFTYDLTIKANSEIIEAAVADIQVNPSYEMTSISRVIMLFFNYDLEPVGIGTGDTYDDVVDLMVKEGMLESKPDAAYFREYMKSFEFWEEGEWVSWEDKNK